MLESARAYVLGQFPLSLETAAHWAATLADLEFYGLGKDYIEGYGTGARESGSGGNRRGDRRCVPASGGSRHRADWRCGEDPRGRREVRHGHRDEDFRSGLRAGAVTLMSDHGSSATAILYAFFANLGHRALQTRGVHLHELGQHAGRGHSLVRGLRQPGVAVPGAQAVAEAGRRQTSARLRQDHLFLELHRRAAAVLHGRPVLDVRGLAQAARARAAQQGVGGAAGARRVDRARDSCRRWAACARSTSCARTSRWFTG